MSASIPFKELEQFVVEFVERKQPGYSKSTLKNLLTKENKKVGVYDSGCFLGQVLTFVSENDNVNEDIYNDSVAACVRGYTSVKDSAINIFRRLTDKLQREKKVDFQPQFPEISVSNTFERLMYISKYIQNPENKISDLEDVLWVSPRTIENDLARLRGDDDPIQVCGKKYIIRDIERERDSIRDMASTPHPFFLTCNLTQVIVMLKGLKEMSENPAMYGYAMKTAGEIWEQLSEYAQNRILYVTEHLMPDQVEWYQGLCQAEKKHEYGDEAFWPEYSCSSYGCSAVLECLKNKKLCNIEYQTATGSKFYCDVKIVRVSKHRVRVIVGNQEMTLDMDYIVRSSTNKEDLY